IIETYKKFLPINSKTPVFSLGEGDTPLVKSRNIVDEIGCKSLFFKLEGCNPTGSFKDRGMVLAVAKAVEKGISSIACASTGNTSASAAAYGAYLGLRTTLIVPKGNVARGKLAQAVAYGAHIAMIDGNFDKALEIARELCERHPVELVNSLNPNRIEGQKTASFEIVEELGMAPDHLFIPVGNAGNITAYWKGFKEALESGLSGKLPVMNGYQASGAAPIVDGAIVEEPRTVASAIRIGNPASWELALKVRDESKGFIDKVDDEEILDTYRRLASDEGVFCEPASAASLAGLLKRGNSGESFEGKTIVCVITGNGLKDPDVANEIKPASLNEYPAKIESVEEALTLS
ncbi:MAG: threonine synthase, partial [Dehalococcoidia bacterium]|nr:threonine synthase [Dehalococcoidia bacterium]